MPKYSYVAVDTQNKRIKDTLDARDAGDLRQKLRDMHRVPIKYHIVEESHHFYRLKANEAAEFSGQMASMLSSGITVVRAIGILMERDFKKPLVAVYTKLYHDVKQGITLSDAMRMQPKAFPDLLVDMYVSGETSGQLDLVAGKMATHYEKEHKLNGKIKSAMTYPIFLLVATIAVVMVIFIFILPEFYALFVDIELPGITQLFMGLSAFLQSYWFLTLMGFLLLVLLLRYLIKIPAVRLGVDRLKLRLPVVGKLLKIIYTARFARTLSSLYSSGISMITALEISATIINNTFIESQFDEVVKDVRNGEYLSEAVGKVVGFDKKLATTILIGEEAGRLDTMLSSTAESFDYEAETAALRLVQIIEPVMIVVMAVVVGTVILSVMLPIISLYNNIG